MPNRMLNLEEGAEYLHIKGGELARLVKQGEIPFEMQGDRCVFRRRELDAWASRHILGSTSRRLEEYHANSSRRARGRTDRHLLMPEMVKVSHIQTDLHAKTKSSVLRAMVGLAEETGMLYDPADLLASLTQREELCSTGMPGGWALLHPRHHEPYLFADSFILLARTAQKIAFGASDGDKTDLFFLVCCQDDAIHLHTLARMCTMVQKTDLLGQLRTVSVASEMYDSLLQAERAVVPAE